MQSRLPLLALTCLLVCSCVGNPFATDEHEPATVVGKTSAVVTKGGLIPLEHGQFIGSELPEGSVVPMNIVVDKQGRQFHEVDLRELDRIHRSAQTDTH